MSDLAKTREVRVGLAKKQSDGGQHDDELGGHDDLLPAIEAAGVRQLRGRGGVQVLVRRRARLRDRRRRIRREPARAHRLVQGSIRLRVSQKSKL